jgi:hypothetical protein
MTERLAALLDARHLRGGTARRSGSAAVAATFKGF